MENGYIDTLKRPSLWDITSKWQVTGICTSFNYLRIIFLETRQSGLAQTFTEIAHDDQQWLLHDIHYVTYLF